MIIEGDYKGKSNFSSFLQNFQKISSLNLKKDRRRKLKFIKSLKPDLIDIMPDAI